MLRPGGDYQNDTMTPAQDPKQGKIQETDIQNRVAEIKGKINNKMTDKGTLARKYRHLRAELERLEEYLDSDNKLSSESLFIKEAMAGAGTPLRRWRTRARGGGTPIIKRTSHIRITLSDE